MRKDTFFFNGKLIGVNKSLIRRPVDEYKAILSHLFGLYSYSVDKRIKKDLDTLKSLADDDVIYLERYSFEFAEHMPNGTLYSRQVPSDKDIEDMISLFRCFAREVKKAPKEDTLFTLMSSSPCFSGVENELDKEYSSLLDSGEYLVFSLNDYPEQD